MLIYDQIYWFKPMIRLGWWTFQRPYNFQSFTSQTEFLMTSSIFVCRFFLLISIWRSLNWCQQVMRCSLSNIECGMSNWFFGDGKTLIRNHPTPNQCFEVLWIFNKFLYTCFHSRSKLSYAIPSKMIQYTLLINEYSMGWIN